MTIATNYQPHAKPVSWVTGLEYGPAQKSKCVRCKTQPATCWVSYVKPTNKAKTKTTVAHAATCEACNEPYASEQNAKAEAKAAKGPKAKKSTKTAAGKPAPKPGGLPALTADEQAIATKYGIEVKAGSLRYDETRKKKVFTLYCTICKRPREVATQDAFQVRTCGEPECKKAHKKANG